MIDHAKECNGQPCTCARGIVLTLPAEYQPAAPLALPPQGMEINPTGYPGIKVQGGATGYRCHKCGYSLTVEYWLTNGEIKTVLTAPSRTHVIGCYS